MNIESYITGHYSGVQGVNLYYRGWIPADCRALIILIHGAGEHSGRYSHVGEECLRRQIALIAPDLRGFGQSEGARGHINRFQDYLDDLESLITLLQVRYPSLPLFLLGHSLGGLIVIRYGQQYPGKVNGAVLSSPALGLRIHVPYPLKKMAEFISWITPNLSVEPLKWNEMLRKLSWLRPILPDRNSEILHDPSFTIQYTPRWFTEFLLNGFAALSEAAKFQFPTLCLSGQQDPLIDPGLIQQFFDSITTRDKAYVKFADGRHRPLHEHYKDQAVNNIFQWLYTRL
jgi:lysophospholipase